MSAMSGKLPLVKAMTWSAMSKTENHRQPWTKDQVQELKRLAKENTSIKLMGIMLGRTAEAVQGKALKLGIRLKPANRRPK
jgi:hypothetical protein